jgi:hypothetical protein
MDSQNDSNTASNKAHGGKPFTKGDPRINRKGRPKSFDQLRKLAQSLADEPAIGKDGKPIIVDGHIATQAEMIMRGLLKENPERFLEIGYGKVPDQVELSGRDGSALTWRVEFSPEVKGDDEKTGTPPPA